MKRRARLSTTALRAGTAALLAMAGSGCVSSRSLAAPVLPQETPAVTAAPAPTPDAERWAADPGHAWTRAEAMAYAWSHNRAIARARWRIAGAAAAVDQADSELLPSLRVDGMASTRSNDSGVSFNGIQFVTGDRSVATGDILAVVPLFGTPLGRREGARHGLTGARAEIEQVRADTGYAIAGAMADLREARARVELIAASVAALVEQARIADDRARAGLAFPTDALADRVRLAEREQDRLHAQNEAATALGRLDQLLGLPSGRGLVLADEGAPPATVDGEEAMAHQALAQRRDLAAARERLLEASAGVRDAQTGYLPQASLVGGYYLTTDSLVLNRQWFGAGLNVSIPLLDNGVVAARVDAKRARAGELAEAVEELSDGIREEVHEALLALGEATARIPVAEQASALAEQRHEQVQDQYRRGVADMTTVLAAENESVTARLRSLHARMDLRRAADQLAHATHASIASPP